MINYWLDLIELEINYPIGSEVELLVGNYVKSSIDDLYPVGTKGIISDYHHLLWPVKMRFGTKWFSLNMLKVNIADKIISVHKKDLKRC